MKNSAVKSQLYRHICEPKKLLIFNKVVSLGATPRIALVF